MYNSELTKLIDLTIVDGQLTDKERQVLMRRAQTLGIDADEFDVYLDGVLYQRREKLGLHAAPPAPAYRPAADNDHANGPLKCPSCKEVINGLNHVCPSCGLVIDADHDSHGNLEEMMEEQEDLLLRAKALARQQAPAPGGGVLYLALPLGLMATGAVLLLGESPVLGTGLWVLAVGLYWLLRKQRPTPPTPNPLLAANAQRTAEFELAGLRDSFTKNERQIRLFFGADRNVTGVLDTLNREMQALAVPAAAPNRPALIPWALRAGIVATVLVVAWVRSNTLQHEYKIQTAADKLLSEGHPAEALALAEQMEVASNRDNLKARINAQVHVQMQSDALNQRLDTLQAMILRRRFTATARELAQLRWPPDSNAAGQRARRSFMLRKAAINDQLPERYRIGLDGPDDQLDASTDK